MSNRRSEDGAVQRNDGQSKAWSILRDSPSLCYRSVASPVEVADITKSGESGGTEGCGRLAEVDVATPQYEAKSCVTIWTN
jgi:hypothetical protein